MFHPPDVEGNVPQKRLISYLWMVSKPLRTGQKTGIDMTKSIIAILFVAATSVACATSNPLPHDVQTYIDHRDICEHLLGEIPDKPTDSDIDRTNKACDGADAGLERLRAKYKADPVVIKRLSGYEYPFDSAGDPASASSR